MRHLLFIAIAVLVFAGAGARATQSDPLLDSLFERLAAAPDKTAAARAETMIWILWLRTDNLAAAASVQSGLDAMSRGDSTAAHALLSGAVETDPNYAEAWNKRATLYYLEGDYLRSIADIRRALALEPRHFGALMGLGLIYDSLGEDRAALTAYRAALAIHPHMADAKARVDALTVRLEGRPL